MPVSVVKNVFRGNTVFHFCRKCNRFNGSDVCFFSALFLLLFVVVFTSLMGTACLIGLHSGGLRHPFIF